MRKKGSLFDKPINLVIGIIVVLVVIAFIIFGLGLPNKLRILLPNFNESAGTSGGMEGGIFNQDGRCKPEEGIYSLKKNINQWELEVWDGSKWVNIEKYVASDEEIFNKQIKNALSDPINTLKLKLNGEEYSILFTYSGFESIVNGATYVYFPPNILEEKTRDSGELVELLPNGESVSAQLMKEDYEKILAAFQSSINEAVIGMPFDALPIIKLEVSYNTDPEQSTTSGDVQERISKIFAYVDTGAYHFEKAYGIDFSKKLYLLNFNPGRDYTLISDWREIPGEAVATEEETARRSIKDKLINLCKNEK